MKGQPDKQSRRHLPQCKLRQAGWVWSPGEAPPPLINPHPYDPSSLRRLRPRVWRWRTSAPLSAQNAGVSTATHCRPPTPPPPTPVPFPTSSTFAFICHLSQRCSLHLQYRRGQVGVRSRGKEGWDTVKGGGGRRAPDADSRKIISARRLRLRLKPDLHFKSDGRPRRHLRDAVGPAGVSFNVSR